ncbi:MAG: hypothetical protein HYX92_07095 [Chloroflexi bacterium]|nr:hypothetical protein [Chloroflexota bacterium]
MQLLIGMLEKIQLPRKFNSHMFTLTERGGTTLVLLGHAPRFLLDQALDLPGLPRKLVIAQEEMHSTPKTYDVWPFEGEVRTAPLTMTLYEALRLSAPSRPAAAPGATPVAKTNPAVEASPAAKDVSPATATSPPPKDVSPVILPTVIAAGLADGINPCAFAVMAFFTAVLFALRRSRRHILKIGAAYIAAMYLTYFAIGLGLLRSLDLLGQPHLVIQAGAAIVIALGLIQLKDGLLPGLPLHLTIPRLGWQLIQSWARRANLLAAAVVGGLVGLCTLPCSGGIYVAILGMLSSQTGFVDGFGYLALYNLMFIVPLIVILLAITSRPMSLALAGWERAHTRALHGATGAIMVALGVFILGWLS